MEKAKVIVKVEEPTDWCAPIVVVPKPGSNEVRLCVDLTKLNNAVKQEQFMLLSVSPVLAPLGLAKVFSKLDTNSGSTTYN